MPCPCGNSGCGCTCQEHCVCSEENPSCSECQILRNAAASKDIPMRKDSEGGKEGSVGKSSQPPEAADDSSVSSSGEEFQEILPGGVSKVKLLTETMSLRREVYREEEMEDSTESSPSGQGEFSPSSEESFSDAAGKSAEKSNSGKAK